MSMLLSLVLGAALAAPFPQLELEAAVELVAEGQYMEAAEALTELIEQRTFEGDAGAADEARLLHLLGVCYLKLSNLPAAEMVLQQSVQLAPKSFDARYDLALTHYRQLRYTSAIVVLNQAQKMSTAKNRHRLQRLRGLSHIQGRDWRAAIRDLKPAMKVDPDPGTLIQLGRAYLGRGNNRKALEAFRQAQGLDSMNGEAYRLASVALVRIAQDTKAADKKLELYSEALVEAEGLIAAWPNSWLSWYQAGRAAIGAQELDKAEEYLLQVLAERPDYCQAMINLTRVYQAQDRFDESVELIEHAEACAPELAPQLHLGDFEDFEPAQPD